MFKRFMAITLFLAASAALLLLFSCTTATNDNDMLVGTWLSNDVDERWTFRSDDTFLVETDPGTGWGDFMNGTFTYIDADHQLTLYSGGTIIMDLLLNATHDRMAQGVEALRGGDTGTLLGTWEGEVILPSATQTHTWIFSAGSLTYNEKITGSFPVDETANASVTIDTIGMDFTVSSSDNTSVLPNANYEYIIIGDGVVISDPDNLGDPDELQYFDKL
jgi:hypothetical protein